MEATYGAFETMATTFVITSGQMGEQYNRFLDRYSELEKHRYDNENVPAKHCQQNIWMVKPAGLNQGRGIEIFKSRNELLQFIEEKEEGT